MGLIPKGWEQNGLEINILQINQNVGPTSCVQIAL